MINLSKRLKERSSRNGPEQGPPKRASVREKLLAKG
jgi:hypothetical protein